MQKTITTYTFTCKQNINYIQKSANIHVHFLRPFWTLINASFLVVFLFFYLVKSSIKRQKKVSKKLFKQIKNKKCSNVVKLAEFGT
jgi:hypothetical protein